MLAQADTEGGNVSGVDAAANVTSAWHAVVGQTSGAAAVPLTIVATPDNITYHVINTGANSCTYGVSVLNLLFSNSSSSITSLSRGNLSVLDSFMNRIGDNGSSTLPLSTSFTTSYGTITGVPTTYTNAHIANMFRMGYLNDQNGNIVMITPVVDDGQGYNGSLFDFQLMLPTQNISPTPYYLTVDLECKSKPHKPPHEEECDSDNDCDEDEICWQHNCVRIPCTEPSDCPSDMTCKNGWCSEWECEERSDCDEDEACVDHLCVRLLCEEPSDCPPDMTCKQGECREWECTEDSDCDEDETCSDHLCVREGMEGVEVTPELCIPELYCLEWGACEDGYRYQPCTDLTGCSDIEIYRVEECLPPITEQPVPEIKPEIIPIIVEPESPCLPFAVIIAALLILWVYRKKRESK